MTQDKKEPSMVETTIPFVSPVLGMGSKKGGFYTAMSDKHKLPIYTLRLPGSKLYVVNSTALIPMVQRHHRIISFAPIESKVALDVMGCSETSFKIINIDPTKDSAFLMSFNKAIHPSLTPGNHLDAMNKVFVRRTTELLDNLQTSTASTPKKLNLFEWTRHSFLRVTTDAVYGSRNPFRDPALEEAWYTFEPAVIVFVLGLPPSLFAREALKARDKMISALEQYFISGAPDDPDASGLVRARRNHNNAWSIPVIDQARFELGNVFAILSNTLAASFWVLFHVYSDPQVLSDIRGEVSRLITTTNTTSSQLHTIDAAKIMNNCPILFSTLREVFRYHGIGVSARFVLEDHLLDGKYLLKKNNIVMIPGRVQHMDPSIWGPDVRKFNHRRFLKTDPSYQQYRPSPVAFRGFGGGVNLCPGRHFASTEILVFTALMVMRFDICPSNGRKWVEPKVDKAPQTATIPVPDTDIEVEVRLRGSREQKWRVEFSGAGKAMELSAEDIDGSGHA